MTSARAPDPLDSDVVDSFLMEGSIDVGRDVVDLVAVELGLLIVNKLEAPLVHRRLTRRRLFLGGQGGLPVADYCPLTRGGGSCHIRTCVYSFIYYTATWGLPLLSRRAADFFPPYKTKFCP